MIRALAAALLALLALLPAPALAQREGSGNMRAALVAEGRPEAGRSWMLALHFTPRSPEWHGYWKNPGDAGVGMRLDWRLPPGWRAGEPLYPVPNILTIAGLVNHIYEGEYAVLVPVTVPAGAEVVRAPPITVTADYLACTDRICVPERATLSLDPAGVVPDPRFGQWRAAIAPLLDRAATFAAGAGRLRIAIPLPASLDIPAPHVFVAAPGVVNYGATQSFTRDGNRLVASLALTGPVPDRLEGIVALGGGNGLRFTARPGAVPAGGTPFASAGGALPALWLALIGALAGGLLLNVMPCVFPILSLKALALARAGGEERAARRDALAYAAGVMIACLALGALLLALRAGGEQVGWAFQLQEPGVVAALLVLASAITANFLGLFEVPSLRIAGSGQRAATGGGGSFATGLLAAFIATPCTGPFMAAAMGAALLLPAAQALLLFAALGLGLALPFLLLGFVPRLRRLLPKPGPWMARFQRLMAIPMGLTALALAWLVWRQAGAAFLLGAAALAAVAVALLHLLWSPRQAQSAGGKAAAALLATSAAALVLILPRLEAAPAASSAASLLDTQPFSEAALAAARAKGRPVFVYFTADWCLSCKVNEGAAIERIGTRDAFERAGVVVLRGDWTRRDEEITRFLTAQGAAGVPLYLWYRPGSAVPEQLPQVLTPGLLAGLAHGSARSVPRPAGSD